jgi:hypothetical protein
MHADDIEMNRLSGRIIGCAFQVGAGKRAHGPMPQLSEGDRSASLPAAELRQAASGDPAHSPRFISLLGIICVHRSLPRTRSGEHLRLKFLACLLACEIGKGFARRSRSNVNAELASHTRGNCIFGLTGSSRPRTLSSGTSRIRHLPPLRSPIDCMRPYRSIER